MGLVGCGGDIDGTTDGTTDESAFYQEPFAPIPGCPVELAPTPGQMLIAAEAVFQWNGPRSGCLAAINPMGVEFPAAYEVRDVKALIAELVCEVAPC